MKIFLVNQKQTKQKKAGEEVREAIKRLGGQIPERLPRKEHIKLVKSRIKKQGKEKLLNK